MGRFDIRVVTTSHNQKEQVFRLYKNFKKRISLKFKMFVAESGDLWVSENNNIKVIKINDDNFWCGAIKHALLESESENPDCPLVICNCDIYLDSFNVNISKLTNPVSAYTIYKNKVQKSGYAYTNLYNGFHDYKGLNYEISNLKNHKVDVVPCRFIFFGEKSLNNLDLISSYLPDTKYIPHYGADYVFTAKISSSGSQFILENNIIIREDYSTTGIKKFKNNIERFKSLISIKSPFNIKFFHRTIVELSKYHPVNFLIYYCVSVIKFAVRWLRGY